MKEQPGPSPARSTVFRSLQAGRGIAALGVVLYHCEGLLSLGKYWAAPRYYFVFGASGVEFFFVLSGIVILHAHLRDVGKPERLGSYVEKRFRRIYPIYWVILLALLPLYFAMPGFGKGFERTPSGLVDAFLLLPLFSPDTIIPVAWTLTHEILFYVVFAVLLLRKRWGVAALLAWMAAALACLWLPAGHPLLGTYFSSIHLLFGLGMLARLLWARVEWNGLWLAVVGVVGYAACAAVEVVRHAQFLALVYGVFAFLLCLGCMLLEKRQPMRVPRWLMVLGEASYSLYLVHYAVLSAVGKVVFREWQRHPAPLAVPFLVLVTIAVAAGLAVHFCVEAPLLRWMSPKKVKAA